MRAFFESNAELALLYYYVCYDMVENLALRAVMERILFARVEIARHFQAHETLANAHLPGIGRETSRLLEVVLTEGIVGARKWLQLRIRRGFATEHLLTIPPSRKGGTRVRLQTLPL